MATSKQTKTKQNETNDTRHAEARQRCVGVRGCSYKASSQPGTEDDGSVSYGASFEPLWGINDDITMYYEGESDDER